MDYKTIHIQSWLDTLVVGNYHVILPQGQERWLVNFKEHREDGPAITYKDDEHPPMYYLNGVRYTKQEYYKELLKRGLTTEEEVFIVCL